MIPHATQEPRCREAIAVFSVISQRSPRLNMIVVSRCPRGPTAVRAMLDADRPGPLALSSLLKPFTTNLSDPLFGDILGVLQALARATGCLTLPTPRDSVLNALARAALPPRESSLRPQTATSAGRFPVSLESHAPSCKQRWGQRKGKRRRPERA